MDILLCLQMFSMLITYLVLLIQFQPSGVGIADTYNQTLWQVAINNISAVEASSINMAMY